MQAPNKSDRAIYRAVIAKRRSRSKVSHGDRAYFIYVAGLLILTVAPSGFTAVRFLIVKLGLNVDPSFSTTALGILAVALVLASRVRGPVTSSLPDIDFLLGAPMDWGVIHSRTGHFWIIISAAVGAIVSAVLGVLELGFTPEVLAIGGLSGIGAGLGLYLWLIGGQLTASMPSKLPYVFLLVLSVVITALGAFGVCAVNPAAWVSVIVYSSLPIVLAILLSVTLTCALLGMTIVCNRMAARKISREYLRAQEWAWSSALAGTYSLNPQIVSEAVFRERNYFRGVDLRAIATWLHPAVARDLLGFIRRWPRSAFSMIISAAAAAIISLEPSSLIAWLLGSGLLTLAGRMSSVGLRSHASNLGRSTSLEGQTVSSLFAHLVVPALVLCIGATTGIITGWFIGATPSLAWTAILALILISLCVQGVPAYSMQLPLYLMGPVLTPAGDISSFMISGWLMRIYILTLVAAWTIYTAATTGTVIQLAAWSTAWVAIAAAWSWRSLRQERKHND